MIIIPRFNSIYFHSTLIQRRFSSPLLGHSPSPGHGQIRGVRRADGALQSHGALRPRVPSPPSVRLPTAADRGRRQHPVRAIRGAAGRCESQQTTNTGRSTGGSIIESHGHGHEFQAAIC